MLTALKGIPLNKTERNKTERKAGDPHAIRPLALPEVFVRLAEAGVMSHCRKAVYRLVGGGVTEFGCGGGAESLPLMVRTLLAQHPDWVVIKGDVKNGFGTVSRAAIIKQSAQVTGLEALAQFLFGAPSNVNFSQPARGGAAAVSLDV